MARLPMQLVGNFKRSASADHSVECTTWPALWPLFQGPMAAHQIQWNDVWAHALLAGSLVALNIFAIKAHACRCYLDIASRADPARQDLAAAIEPGRCAVLTSACHWPTASIARGGSLAHHLWRWPNPIFHCMLPATWVQAATLQNQQGISLTSTCAVRTALISMYVHLFMGIPGDLHVTSS